MRAPQHTHAADTADAATFHRSKTLMQRAADLRDQLEELGTLIEALDGVDPALADEIGRVESAALDLAHSGMIAAATVAERAAALGRIRTMGQPQVQAGSGGQPLPLKRRAS